MKIVRRHYSLPVVLECGRNTSEEGLKRLIWGISKLNSPKIAPFDQPNPTTTWYSPVIYM
jgi:hypothetical protein